MKTKRTRTLQSAKYLQKKRKRIIVRSILIVICVLGLSGSIVAILNIKNFQISQIKTTGIETLDEAEIQGKVFSILQGKYLGVISKSNFLFYPKSEIESSLREGYKKIDSVNVEREGISGVSIQIVESEPVAIVCDGFREGGDHDKCYFVDGEAYVFEKAESVTDGVYMKYYLNKSDDSIEIGEHFILKDEFTNLQKFVDNALRSNISVAGVLIGENGSYELYVTNPDESVTVVYFDDRTPLEKTSSNLLAFWHSAQNMQLGTTTVPIFDYINLRFGNNIFYTTR